MDVSEQINNIAQKVLDAAFIVHKELGPGLLENAYEICTLKLLSENGLKVERQKVIPITFQNEQLDAGFRADLIVEDQVLVELKAVEKIIPLHRAQILTYLKLSKIELGLLLNFNTKLLRDGIVRMALSHNVLRS